MLLHPLIHLFCVRIEARLGNRHPSGRRHNQHNVSDPAFAGVYELEHPFTRFVASSQVTDKSQTARRGPLGTNRDGDVSV